MLTIGYIKVWLLLPTHAMYFLADRDMDYTPVELEAAVESRKRRSLDKYLVEWGKDVVGLGRDSEEPEDCQDPGLIDHRLLVH